MRTETNHTQSGSSATRTRIARPVAVAFLAAAVALALGVTPAHAVTRTAKKPTKTTAKPKIPLPGTPCVERGVNFPGTALDCVNVPARGLQWRVRGTVRNPFRPGEAVEVYSIESSRYRVSLTDWDSDITEESRAQGVDLAVPGVAFLAYRVSSTLLLSGGAKAANRASEATAPFAYVIGPTVRERSSLSLSQVPRDSAQADLPACRNGGIQDGFADPVGKDQLETLQPGETGWNGFCKEVPTEQSPNVVVELNAFNAPGGPNAKTAVSLYFTGIPR